MQITFDPHNVQECATIARLLGAAAPAPAETTQKWTPVNDGRPRHIRGEVTPAQHGKGSGTHDDPYDYSDVKTVEAPAPAQPDTATTEPDTPRADGLTATEQVQTETDCHGMVHDDTIHSTPASKNADGSWRAKRGQKEAYEAAIAAATGKDAPAPAPQGMPVPQPASAAPATPPAPIEYKAMAERFMGKMADPDGLPAEYEAIYTALSIGYDDLETNQTSIARLWHYMNAVDNGDDHDGCVRHAMSAD